LVPRRGLIISKEKGKRKDEVVVCRMNKRMKLNDWGYGIGVEGINESPEDAPIIGAVIVERNFPWWLFSAKSVGLTVFRIWLIDYIFKDVDKFKQVWCNGLPIETGAHPSQALMDNLARSDVVLIGGRIPLVLVDNGLWKCDRIKLILSTESIHSTPRRWKHVPVRCVHALVGGVTDATLPVFAYFSPPLSVNNCGINACDLLLQDLRWIMKSSVGGKQSK
jgi:hypothetical protein